MHLSARWLNAYSIIIDDAISQDADLLASLPSDKLYIAHYVYVAIIYLFDHPFKVLRYSPCELVRPALLSHCPVVHEQHLANYLHTLSPASCKYYV